jgi:hypothetical protein
MARTTKKVAAPQVIHELKTITVQEFKAWLSGVEDMQGEDWHPSAEQWAKIRSKIFSIKDTSSQQQGEPGGAPSGPVKRGVDPTFDDDAAERAVMARFGATMQPTGPLVGAPVGIPQSSLAGVPPTPRMPAQPGTVSIPRAVNVGGKTVQVESVTKTPDVPEGPYKSSFL